MSTTCCPPMGVWSAVLNVRFGTTTDVSTAAQRMTVFRMKKDITAPQQSAKIFPHSALDRPVENPFP